MASPSEREQELEQALRDIVKEYREANRKVRTYTKDACCHDDKVGIEAHCYGFVAGFAYSRATRALREES